METGEQETDSASSCSEEGLAVHSVSLWPPGQGSLHLSVPAKGRQILPLDAF